jgi:hypothetical protein
MGVTRCQIAEDNVTRNLDVLNVGRPAIGVGLIIEELEGSICLITAWND